MAIITEIRDALLSKRSTSRSTSPCMKRTAAIVLGGGQGTRLFPLTRWQCKPAISFGGRYRLIDVPISNSIHSGCQKIFVITQFLSSSLHKHVFNTYRFDRFSQGFIELLPAEERHAEQTWFQGTADAVRKNIDYFIDTPADYFFILSGDQLYKMDFSAMLQEALHTGADLTVAAMPIQKNAAKRMGILQADSSGRVHTFVEKPQDERLIERLHTRIPGIGEQLLGSLGIYLFKRDSLLKLLKEDPREDFGKHLIPSKVASGGVHYFLHDSYWEDIGTIESYYTANISLTDPNPDFDLFAEGNVIFSASENLPGSRINGAHINRSIVSDGVLLESCHIERSILGPRTVVGEGTKISASYIMGNDFYQPEMQTGRLPNNLSIGKNCEIKTAILDKHVSLGNNVRLVNEQGLQFYDSKLACIRDGIIIIPRGAALPDGFTL